MPRKYKQREFFTILCRECNEAVTTNSYATKMCQRCSRSHDFRVNMLDYQWRLGKLYAAAKFRATAKKLEINIDKEFLIHLWERTGGVCSVSGRHFNLNPYGKPGQVHPDAPSVDRIQPELGYVKGNVRLITYHSNVALSEYGLESLQKLAEDILHNGSFRAA